MLLHLLCNGYANVPLCYVLRILLFLKLFWVKRTVALSNQNYGTGVVNYIFITNFCELIIIYS